MGFAFSCCCGCSWPRPNLFVHADGQTLANGCYLNDSRSNVQNQYVCIYFNAVDTSGNSPTQGDGTWTRESFSVDPALTGPCADASFIVGNSFADSSAEDQHEGRAFWVCEYSSQDSDWWYFERTGKSDGVEALVSVSKTVQVKAGLPAPVADQIRCTIWDATHYWAVESSASNSEQLVLVTDASLEAGGRDRCECIGNGSQTVMEFGLAMFQSLRRWTATGDWAGKTAAMGTTHLPDDTAFAMSASGFGGNPAMGATSQVPGSYLCDALNDSITASPGVSWDAETLLDGYYWTGTRLNAAISKNVITGDEDGDGDDDGYTFFGGLNVGAYPVQLHAFDGFTAVVSGFSLDGALGSGGNNFWDRFEDAALFIAHQAEPYGWGGGGESVTASGAINHNETAGITATPDSATWPAAALAAMTIANSLEPTAGETCDNGQYDSVTF